MDVFSSLGDKLEELLHELSSGIVVGNSSFFFSQYTVWMIIAFIVTLIVIFQAKKRIALVPNNMLTNGVEAIVQSLRQSMGVEIIGHDVDKHMPIIYTLFFFILINNLIGIIPGCKPGTGTFSITLAIAVISFVYFNVYGMKAQGAGRYILNLAPKGLVLPLACLIWLIELVSLFLRLLTLAIRLFANMYAGHIMLGVFSILSSMFVTYAIQNAVYVMALPSLGWMLLLLAMYAMELLVAVIQAYVFAMLSAVYIGLAINEH